MKAATSSFSLLSVLDPTASRELPAKDAHSAKDATRAFDASLAPFMDEKGGEAAADEDDDDLRSDDPAPSPAGSGVVVPPAVMPHAAIDLGARFDASAHDTCGEPQSTRSLDLSSNCGARDAPGRTIDLGRGMAAMSVVSSVQAGASVSAGSNISARPSNEDARAEPIGFASVRQEPSLPSTPAGVDGPADTSAPEGARAYGESAIATPCFARADRLADEQVEPREPVLPDDAFAGPPRALPSAGAAPQSSMTPGGSQATPVRDDQLAPRKISADEAGVNARRAPPPATTMVDAPATSTESNVNRSEPAERARAIAGRVESSASVVGVGAKTSAVGVGAKMSAVDVEAKTRVVDVGAKTSAVGVGAKKSAVDVGAKTSALDAGSRSSAVAAAKDLRDVLVQGSPPAASPPSKATVRRSDDDAKGAEANVQVTAEPSASVLRANVSASAAAMNSRDASSAARGSTRRGTTPSPSLAVADPDAAAEQVGAEPVATLDPVAGVQQGDVSGAPAGLPPVVVAVPAGGAQVVSVDAGPRAIVASDQALASVSSADSTNVPAGSKKPAPAPETGIARAPAELAAPVSTETRASLAGTAAHVAHPSEQVRGTKLESPKAKRADRWDLAADTAAFPTGPAPAAIEHVFLSPVVPAVGATTEAIKTPSTVVDPAVAAPLGSDGGPATQAVRAAESLGHKRVLLGSEARGQIDVPELGRIEVRAQAEGARVDVRVRADDDHARHVIVANAPEMRAHVKAEIPNAAVRVEREITDFANGGSGLARDFGRESPSRRDTPERERNVAPEADQAPGRVVINRWGGRVRFVL